MFPVYAGSEDAKKAAFIRAVEIWMLRRGASKHIPLNGSREERADMIAYYEEVAKNIGVPIRVSGRCEVILGGKQPCTQE